MNTKTTNIKDLITDYVYHEFTNLIEREVRKTRLYLEEVYKAENEKLVNKIYDKFMKEMEGK